MLPLAASTSAPHNLDCALPLEDLTADGEENRAVKSRCALAQR